MKGKTKLIPAQNPLHNHDEEETQQFLTLNPLHPANKEENKANPGTNPSS